MMFGVKSTALLLVALTTTHAFPGFIFPHLNLRNKRDVYDNRIEMSVEQKCDLLDAANRASLAQLYVVNDQNAIEMSRLQLAQMGVDMNSDASLREYACTIAGIESVDDIADALGMDRATMRQLYPVIRQGVIDARRFMRQNLNNSSLTSDMRRLVSLTLDIYDLYEEFGLLDLS